MLGTAVHTLHAILAGAWLGGVDFTTTVVSPALKSIMTSVVVMILATYARVG